MAKAYPPALPALEDLRERKAQTLLRGAGGRELFHDVSAIDERLERRRATCELYLALAALAETRSSSAHQPRFCTSVRMS